MGDERLGRYRLIEMIARGGMAEVWRAHDEDRREVCIKRIDGSLRSDVDFLEMFRDEASLVLDLDHENIVHMIELVDAPPTAGERHGELYQVMELVRGASVAQLRALLADSGDTFTLGEALQIAVGLCRGLHHAHTRKRDGVPMQIVHRDVSPQNVLVSRGGKVKLLDFGIAKAAQRLTRTRAGTLKGKSSYMAPEQVRGESLDPRADQFATGVVLWEMLTGRRLFGGRNEVLILEQVKRSDPVPPSAVKKGVPRAVDQAVLKALAWHRSERFADMAAFAAALQAVLDTLVPGGVVDLRPLLQRAMPTEDSAKHQPAGAQGTRVIAAPSTNGGKRAGWRDAFAAPPTHPGALAEHTGQFFLPHKESARRVLTVLGVTAGALTLAAAATAAFLVAERAPPPAAAAPPQQAQPALFVDVASAAAWRAAHLDAVTRCGCAEQAPQKSAAVAELDACLARCGVAGAGAYAGPPLATLEARLRALPGHPCRTELLDDVLDDTTQPRLSPRGVAALADAVAGCERDVRVKAQRKAPAKLDAPPERGGARNTRAGARARAAELGRVGALAMQEGAYDRAKALFVEAVALDPRRVRDHARIGQAFRGLGDPIGAGYHLRLWLHAIPDDADAERITRYLVRYRQQTQLPAAALPNAGTDERAARAARAQHDARALLGKPGTDTNAAVALLQQALTWLPNDEETQLLLGDALVRAGKPDAARAVWETLLAEQPPPSAIRLAKERLTLLKKPSG